MMQYFNTDGLPSSTVVLQHLVNLSGEINRQPLEWRLHHTQLLQGLLLKSLSVLQYKLERHQHQPFGAVRVCVRACARLYVGSFVRACVRACVLSCMRRVPLHADGLGCGASHVDTCVLLLG